MKNPSFLVTFVAMASLAAVTACDSSSGGGNSITCANLNFTSSGDGDIAGVWRAREICVSAVDPTVVDLCAQSTVDATITPDNLVWELRSDNTFSGSGSMTTFVAAFVPRSCADDCNEVAHDMGGTCSEKVDGCDCTATSDDTPYSGGTWKIEAGRLYYRPAGSDWWGNGVEFLIDGNNFVTKRVNGSGVAFFTIYAR
jgi:hypothetical protein